MADRIAYQRGRAPVGAASLAPPVAFLSYAHAETALAESFRDALVSCGLHVIVDIEHLKPGEDIADFARRSVRAADATVCVVSTKSLASAWVVFEAVTTLHKEHVNPAARLIACATDQGFFDLGFQLQITAAVDERLGTHQPARH